MDYGCNNSDQYRMPSFAIISRDSESSDRNVRHFFFVCLTDIDWNTSALIYDAMSSMQVKLTLKVCSRSEMIQRLADSKHWEVNSLFFMYSPYILFYVYCYIFHRTLYLLYSS